MEMWYTKEQCKSQRKMEVNKMANIKSAKKRISVIQKKTLIVDGKKVRLNLSTSAIRTLRKKGLL